MKTRSWIVLISGLLLVTLFQNCSKQGLQVNDLELTAQGQGAVTDTGGGGGNDPTTPTTQPPVTVDDLIKGCRDAADRGKIQVHRTSIQFENPGKTCAWNSDGNLSTRNGYVRARIEQARKVQVPTGATVCEVRMNDLTQQNFRYDDNILLTLNNYILASTTNFSKHFQSKNGFYKYDWMALRDKDGQVLESDSSMRNQYCAGGNLSSCSFPATETYGNIKLSLGTQVIQNILGMTSPNDLTMTMITTGDNDSSDCQHVPVSLDLEVEYY